MFGQPNPTGLVRWWNSHTASACFKSRYNAYSGYNTGKSWRKYIRVEEKVNLGRTGRKGCGKGWVWGWWHTPDHISSGSSLPALFGFVPANSWNSPRWPTERQETYRGERLSLTKPSSLPLHWIQWALLGVSALVGGGEGGVKVELDCKCILDDLPKIFMILITLSFQ